MRDAGVRGEAQREVSRGGAVVEREVVDEDVVALP